MESKKAWGSKTVWTNLILAMAAFVPPVQEYISGHPEMVAIGWSVINIMLRLISKDKIQIG